MLGLEVNKQKTELYVVGMKMKEIQRILYTTRFNMGRLPFRYLGVPICHKRISAKDCGSLIEKITAKIGVWSSRNLSYQGRLLLVNSLLMSVHIY